MVFISSNIPNDLTCAFVIEWMIPPSRHQRGARHRVWSRQRRSRRGGRRRLKRIFFTVNSALETLEEYSVCMLFLSSYSLSGIISRIQSIAFLVFTWIALNEHQLRQYEQSSFMLLIRNTRRWSFVPHPWQCFQTWHWRIAASFPLPGTAGWRSPARRGSCGRPRRTWPLVPKVYALSVAFVTLGISNISRRTAEDTQ